MVSKSNFLMIVVPVLFFLSVAVTALLFISCLLFKKDGISFGVVAITALACQFAYCGIRIFLASRKTWRQIPS